MVLLVGAEFRQLLLDCVSELNSDSDSTDASSDNTWPCRVNSDCVIGSDTDNCHDAVTDVDNITAADSTLMCAQYGHCNDETASVEKAQYGPVWTSFIEHYVKLGETHAYICGFTKNK